MKLTNLLTSLALLVGASTTTTALAGERGLPDRDPGDGHCNEPNAAVIYADCGASVVWKPAGGGGTTPPPWKPPVIRLPPQPSPVQAPPVQPVEPECGYYQLTLTAQQLFPEVLTGMDRARRDLDDARRKLPQVQARHQQLAELAWELSNAQPYDAQRYARVASALERVARAELTLRRTISQNEPYIAQSQQYLQRIGTQIIRHNACMSIDDAKNIIRRRFGAPPL